jgi:hypothetical protein
MYTQQFGSLSRIIYATEGQIARILAYKGDLAGAAEVTERVKTAQEEAKVAGRNDAILTDGERILVDGVDFFLRGETDDKFDALVARGRALQLQGPDIVEILEWKGLGALRAGRRDDALAFLNQALAEAQNTVAFERVRRKVESVAGEAELPRAVGGA